MYAMSVMNGHPFDAKHTFLINRFSDVERYAEMDAKFAEPEREEYEDKVRLSHWACAIPANISSLRFALSVRNI